MNRKGRRAALARGKPVAEAPALDIGRLFDEANQALRGGQPARAEALCKRILARSPGHTAGLNLLGLIHQSAGRHRLAVKMFAEAIATDETDAACHYNIASSYQLLEERAAAAAHFNRAIALGLSGQDVGDLLLQNPAIFEGAKRTIDRTGLPVAGEGLFDERDLAAIANDVFLACALKTAPICGLRLEFFLTQLRSALLRLAGAHRPIAAISEHVLDLFCALAQQCFINEYVFAQTDQEAQDAGRLKEQLEQKLAAAAEIPPVLPAAVAAYFPLCSVPGAQSLAASDWPDCVADLLRQQVDEPRHEVENWRTIPALTEIDDATSIVVMRQYEESPYPRWTVTESATPAVFAAGGRSHTAGVAEGRSPAGADILIAACGTGRHAFYVAQQSPRARILAIDLSRASLAYARKMTDRAGIGNIEYAQADILKLATVGRTFDRIEAVGVLHHLADPNAGLRVLLALLKPGGILRLGLYSEAARRLIVEARALIAERDYPATVEGVRALRRAIICGPHRQRWEPLLATSADFYGTSGCRDLFFNVMEHRFTIPQIAAILREHRLSFLGFELDPPTVQLFQRRYQGPQALTNLECWHAFETTYPDTFRRMYVFEVRKDQPSS